MEKKKHNFLRWAQARNWGKHSLFGAIALLSSLVRGYDHILTQDEERAVCKALEYLAVAKYNWDLSTPESKDRYAQREFGEE